ncbi:hypothetical protein [Rhizobium sp. KDH_Rht_773_N]
MKTLPIANQTETANTWAEQTRQGRQLADALTQQMARDENPLLLSRVLSSLFAAAEPTGIRTGFAQRLAERLIEAPMSPIDTGDGNDILNRLLAKKAPNANI